MGPEARANLVPNFIRAKSPLQLRGLMLENNIKSGLQITYQDINLASDGYWYAWFYEEFNLYTQIKNKKVTEK